MKKTRDEIDQIDQDLTRLFEKRLQLVSDVAVYKKMNCMQIYDPVREAQVLEKNCRYLDNPDFSKELKIFFKSMMDLAKSYEKDLMEESNQVGYQGVEGAFAYLATCTFFPEESRFQKKNFPSFRSVFEALEQREIQYGVIPIDNSSTGSVSENYDLLNQFDCYILAETQIAADQLLLGIPGTKIEEIEEVYSHPQGLAQTSEFLKKYPQWEQIPYANTAVAAKFIKESNDVRKAAIASKESAEFYGLEILSSQITNANRNYTRFLKIGMRPEYSARCNKMSIIFGVHHESGALYKVLEVLSKYQLNMVHLESRPILERPWEYLFYLDFEGNSKDISVSSALEELQAYTSYYKFLGNYPREVF